MHRQQKHSPRQRSELAAFGSSTNTRAAPIPVHLPNGARTEPHQIAHRQRTRISASSHGEGPDKPELRADEVNDVTKPGLLSKLQAILGFTLYLNQRISRRQKVRVQVVAAVGRKSEVAGLVRSLESATQQITASPEMFRPWHDVVSEARIGPGLEALQAAFLNKFVAEATESKSGLVVAEVRSSYDTKPYIGEARTVATSALEAEINRPTDGQGKKVRIRKQCRRQDLGHNIQIREGCWVAHQG